jgi:hypothetical protein
MYFVVNLPDPIIILRTAICHHKNNNNTDNHLYHMMLFYLTSKMSFTYKLQITNYKSNLNVCPFRFRHISVKS